MKDTRTYFLINNIQVEEEVKAWNTKGKSQGWYPTGIGKHPNSIRRLAWEGNTIDSPSKVVGIGTVWVGTGVTGEQLKR